MNEFMDGILGGKGLYFSQKRRLLGVLKIINWLILSISSLSFLKTK